MDRCAECGFTYDLDLVGRAAAGIRSGADEYVALLTGDADVRERPEPAVWSVLEYGCHLRDVLLVQRERVLLARRTDQPTPEQMGRDERVEHDGYAEQVPTDVARQLADAALLFANALGRLGPADWERTLVYHFPEPTVRPLRWVAMHTLHEVRHHLLDARRQVE